MYNGYDFGVLAVMLIMLIILYIRYKCKEPISVDIEVEEEVELGEFMSVIDCSDLTEFIEFYLYLYEGDLDEFGRTEMLFVALFELEYRLLEGIYRRYI